MHARLNVSHSALATGSPKLSYIQHLRRLM